MLGMNSILLATEGEIQLRWSPCVPEPQSEWDAHLPIRPGQQHNGVPPGMARHSAV